VVTDGDTEIEADVAEVFHRYVAAPVAFRIAALPSQTEALLAETVGVAFTVTVDTLVLEHPLEVPVTV